MSNVINLKDYLERLAKKDPAYMENDPHEADFLELDTSIEWKKLSNGEDKIIQ